MGTLRVGDPLDKNTDVGAINSKQQLERIQELVATGEEEGAEVYQPPCRPPGEGLVVPAHGLHDRRAELPDRAGGDLRAGALRPHLPHAGRGGREGEQHAVRPLGRRLDGEGVAHPLDGAAPAGRRRLGEHLQPLRSRPRRSAATRSRASAARAACTASAPYLRFERRAGSRSRRRTSSTSAGRSHARSRGARTRCEGANVARASRKDVRDAVRAARGAFPKWAGDDGVQPRPGALPRRRDDGGAPRAVRRADRRRGRGRRGDRPLGLVRGLGRQARAGARLLEPRRRAVLQLHDPRADGRGRDRRARRARRSRARLAARAGARRRERGRRARLRAAPARGDRRSPRCSRPSDVPGGVVNVLTGQQAGSSARCSPRTWT